MIECGSGPKGRVFKSPRPDHEKSDSSHTGSRFLLYL
nr:MAG TPA: hypothetical protein [Caudoviricetes sp.]